MNVYKKYCPNVFLAESDEELAKGDKITMTTKYGKENECIVWNKILERNGKYYYSITRADGFNSQERAKRRAERLESYAISADDKSMAAYEKSNEAVKDIPFGQPILVDHYSAKKHRATLEKANNAMRSSVEQMHKAENYRNREEYWKSLEGKIDLSMPESIEYYAHRLQEAKRIHSGLKDGSIPREYGMQLQYAKNAVNEAQRNYDIALKLWG
jgi:hypothetical protein